MKRRGPIFLLSLVVLVLVGGGVGWLRWEQARGRVAMYVPPRPDWTGRPAGLAARVQEADARARAGELAGLAELSRLYHANGAYREALWCYEGLMVAEPAEPRWPHLAANLRALFGETAEAEPLWRRVLELAPEHTAARVKLGEMLLKANRHDEAAALFDAVLAAEPEHPQALIGRARVDLVRGDRGAARGRLERVVARTDFRLGADLLATVYEELGDGNRARVLRGRQKHHGAHQAVRDPWLHALNDDGYDAYQLALESGAASFRGDDEDAWRWLERALALEPENGQLHHQAAKLWEGRRNQIKAKAAYERAVELDAGISDAWARLYTLNRAMGETGVALRVLREGLEANPDSPVLLLERARRYQELGRPEAALVDLERVVDLRHDDATAALEAARLLLSLERVGEAVTMLDLALEAEPEHPLALILQCFTAISREDRVAADRWMARVRAQPRVAATDLEGLAGAYRQVFGAAPPEE